MDEVHYLADRFRGAVWEEVIIHLPASVRLVSLSATVSNAEEFADWLVTVRGETAGGGRRAPAGAAVAAHAGRQPDVRPVPRARRRPGRRSTRCTRSCSAYARERRAVRRTPVRPGRPGPAAGGRRRASTSIERLDRDGLLPAIMFIFSRAGCDAAVQQCLAAGLRLTTPDERGRDPRDRRGAHRPSSPPEDLDVLGYWEWLDGLRARAGRPPRRAAARRSRRWSRSCSSRGLVKAVFATETLALGINMPARCVVLERLVKFNGETHVDLTPGEYTQLTGRAGRRGIDVEGHAVVVWSPEVDPRHVAGLASTRTYPLRSRFRPSYNMAVNLVGSVGRPQARELLESSFAQFQADRSVVGLARQVQRNEETMAGVRASRCAATSATSPSTSRCAAAIAERETALARQGAAQRRAAAEQSLERLRLGDVIRVPTGRRAGLAVVLDPGVQPASASPARWCSPRTGGPAGCPPADFPTPVEALARVRVPKHFDHRSPQARRDLAATLRNARAGGRAAAGSRGRSPAARRRRARPAAPGAAPAPLPRLRGPGGARPLGRAARPAGARHRRRCAAGWQNRTDSLARTFDQVCALLDRPRLPGRQRRRRRRGHRRRPEAGPDLVRGRPAGRRVPAAPGSGTGWPRPSSPRPCPCWCTSRAGRPRRRCGARGPGRATRWRRPGGCGPSWRRTSSGTGWR